MGRASDPNRLPHKTSTRSPFRELKKVVMEFLASWDEPDSPEAMIEAVRKLREAVENA